MLHYAPKIHLSFCVLLIGNPEACPARQQQTPDCVLCRNRVTAKLRCPIAAFWEGACGWTARFFAGEHICLVSILTVKESWMGHDGNPETLPALSADLISPHVY